MTNDIFTRDPFCDRVYELDGKIRDLLKERREFIAAEVAAGTEGAASPWFALGEITCPIQVDEILFSERSFLEPGRKLGRWVSVRVAGEKETRLGVMIGEIAMGALARFKRLPGANVIEIGPGLHNPAMWVPGLGRVVFGCESWWGAIKSPEDLRQITDTDIESVWYVQALKSLEAAPEPDK